MEYILKDDEVSKITVSYADITDKEREKVFKNVAQAAYNLCLYEYKRGLEKTNENQDNIGTTKSIK